MAHRIGSLVVVGMLGVAAFGCGSDSPTTPSTPALVSLEGRVNESAPNGDWIEGATVTILDGANAGLIAKTDFIGRYVFRELTQGNANFAVTAPGYLEARAGAFINGENRTDFVLQRAP